MDATATSKKKPCYLIFYKVDPENDYTTLIGNLKRNDSWVRLSRGVWGVVTDRTAEDITDQLADILGPFTRILVVRTAGEGSWRNFPNSSHWLEDHL